jgi:molybdopterin converting factor small subunit
MKVLIPSPLRPYTRASEVDAEGATIAEMLRDLDRKYPGFRFRMIDEQDKIRPHIRVFVNGVQTFDIAHPLRDGDGVQIVQALSGG